MADGPLGKKCDGVFSLNYARESTVEIRLNRFGTEALELVWLGKHDRESSFKREHSSGKHLCHDHVGMSVLNYLLHRISKIASTSTATPVGNAANPTALRAW